MTEVNHIEHTIVALTRKHNTQTNVGTTITIGMIGCAGMVTITSREGIQALRDACEAALHAAGEARLVGKPNRDELKTFDQGRT